MNFLFPGFLWALLALSVPIIIHLFNFRRFKKIIFPNVKFLREVQLQTKSQSRLKHLLVLLARLLALLFLVFAFAQPIIPEEGAVNPATRENAVSIFVDNSFSMNAEGEQGILLETAKNKAREIAGAFGRSDRYQLLTNNFEGKQQRWLSREEFLEAVDNIEPGPAARSIKEITSRQQDLFSPGDEGAFRSFIISDFQESILDLEGLQPDSLYPAIWVPLYAEVNQNLYIDSVWFRSPLRKANDNDELVVRVVNAGESRMENIPLTLSVNGTRRSVGSFTVEPGGVADSVLFFTNDDVGISHAVVSLEDHPVTFDDDFYFSYRITENVSILNIENSISETTRKNYFHSLFADDEQFSFETISLTQIDYSSLSSYDFIILNELNDIPSGLIQELDKFSSNGGSVLVVPGSDIDGPAYNSLFGTLGLGALMGAGNAEMRASGLRTDHPLYDQVFEKIPENIDLPSVKKYYKISLPVKSRAEAIITLQNGDPLLIATRNGNGKCYSWAVPLNSENNNVSQHAIFVTSSLRMGETSLPEQQLYQIIGHEEPIIIHNVNIGADESLVLRNVDQTNELIPERRTAGGNTLLFTHNQIKESGNFNINRHDSILTGLGFNYDRRESQINTAGIEDLEKAIEDHDLFNVRIIENYKANLTSEIQTEHQGTRLWKICILLALIFLLAEIFLLKFWKKNTHESAYKVS